MEAIAAKAPARGRGKRRIAIDAGDADLGSAQQATTLDRVHAAMLLQAGGRTNALRALLQAEKEHGAYLLRVFVDVDRDPPDVVTAYRTSKIEKYWRRHS